MAEQAAAKSSGATKAAAWAWYERGLDRADVAPSKPTCRRRKRGQLPRSRFYWQAVSTWMTAAESDVVEPGVELQPGESDVVAIGGADWDCGSTLFDAFELVDMSKRMDKMDIGVAEKYEATKPAPEKEKPAAGGMFITKQAGDKTHAPGAGSAIRHLRKSLARRFQHVLHRRRNNSNTDFCNNWPASNDEIATSNTRPSHIRWPIPQPLAPPPPPVQEYIEDYIKSNDQDRYFYEIYKENIQSNVSNLVHVHHHHYYHYALHPADVAPLEKSLLLARAGTRAPKLTARPPNAASTEAAAA